jgi:hypothetical protein
MEKWIITDPSCNQQMLQIDEDIFEFKELRILNPETGETYLHESTVDLKNYNTSEVYEFVAPFGYTFDDVLEWFVTGTNKALIAECIFEMTN